MQPSFRDTGETPMLTWARLRALTPRHPTVRVVRHSTKLLSLTLSLVDFLDSSSPIALARLRAAP